jgi:hypothetical protein
MDLASLPRVFLAVVVVVVDTVRVVGDPVVVLALQVVVYRFQETA